MRRPIRGSRRCAPPWTDSFAQVLRQVIDWGLRHGAGWHVDTPARVEPGHSLVVCLAPAVRSKVHTTTRAAGGDASAWVCHLQHQVNLADLPTTWQVGEADARSHDSRDGGTRDSMRVDGPTRQKLDELSTHVRTSMTEVIRQSVAQASPKDVPPA